MSRKDTLVAYRVAAGDIEYFKQCAVDDYKSGEIKAPTLAALAKHLLYQHLNILKDIEKARAWRAQQPQNSAPELEEPNLETADVNNYQTDDDGSELTRPFFYELFPDWKDRIARMRHEHN